MAKPKVRSTKSAKSAKNSENRLRDKEYKKLISRAETVAKQLGVANDDEAYKLEEGAWAKVVDSFDAWATKYKMKLKTGLHDHGAGSNAGGGPVPRTRDTCLAVERGQENLDDTHILVTTCLFKRRTITGRCVYKCYSGVFEFSPI
jgi:hypothetical protein